MNKITENGLSTQNKLIITAVIVSTIVIFLIAGFAISKIQTRLSESYIEFGQLTTKTLASEVFELTKNTDEIQAKNILKAHAKAILDNNKEITFLEFQKDNKIVYSTKKDFPKRTQNTKITISSPFSNSEHRSLTTVTIGLSADMIWATTKAAKHSMMVVFTLAWLVFSSIVLLNTFLITRELRILHQGVKAITKGKFGTILKDKNTSGEIKELFSAFNDMSKRLHIYEEQNIEQLTVEKNKFEAILMSIANGVVVCDNSDKIILVNGFALEILKAQKDNLLNTGIQDYEDIEGVCCFKDKIEIFKDTPLDKMEKTPLDFNIEMNSSTIKTVISPIFSKSHDYLGYIIVLIDVTKEAKIDKLKSDFISNVSHELRTPVTVLRSYVDTLYTMGEQFDIKEQKEFMETINTEVIRLNKMVNDILDFSRLNDGEVELEKYEGDISLTIERTVNAMRVLSDEKNMTIRILKDEALPLIFYNEDSIERVMNNLLSNAVKYSPDKSQITVEIKNKKDFVEVSVTDEGMGIDKIHLDKIFDRFYRIENATHTIKGTGLGLNLVKTTIEKYHFGEVFVNSVINEGSTFGFRLPKIKSEAKINVA